MKGNGHSKNKQYTSEYIALLYQKYSYKLYHSAFRYTSNISTAEDGVQLVFEKILLHPKTALEVPEDEILYFLFAVLRNVMYTITKDEAKNSHFPLGYDEDINNSQILQILKMFLFVSFTQNVSKIFFLNLNHLFVIL